MPVSISRTSTATTSTASLTSTAKSWAEGFDFGSSSAVSRLDVARSKAPTTGPETLQRAWALYQSWEENDLGSVRLLKLPGGQGGYALHTTTDGDDGYLELFSEKGALLASGTTGFDRNGNRDITWDSKPGAVRERVAPKGSSASTKAFFSDVAKGQRSSSALGTTLSTTELRRAASRLVGSELTTASVDGFERAGLLRVLADPAAKLTTTSRAYATQLAELYSDAGSPSMTKLSKKPLGSGTLASGTVSAKGAPPRMNTMIALARKSFDLLPSQVVPVTRAEATKALRAAGASAAEARTALDALADSKGRLYAGRFFDSSGVVPSDRGLALFGVSSNGRVLSALHVPQTATPTTGTVPRDVIKALLGVDREVEVAARTQTRTGETFDLRWRPSMGGLIEAKLTVPSNGDPKIEGLSLGPPNEAALEENLAQRLTAALGASQKVLGWVGRDNNGVGFVVAHQPSAGGPIKTTMVRIAVGGATASITPQPLGAADQGLARDLALNLARAHAAKLVDDPAIDAAAKLEVALRTRWATQAELQAVDPADSAVGFDPTRERFQFMLPRVWGDNAVFVTFAKDGTARVEDFN